MTASKSTLENAGWASRIHRTLWFKFNKLARISDRLWSSSEDKWGIQYSPTAYLINKTRRIDITVCLLTKGWVCEIKLLTPDQTLGVLWAVRSVNTNQEVSSVYSYIYIRAEFKLILLVYPHTRGINSIKQTLMKF